jgi:hypothetical protein
MSLDDNIIDTFKPENHLSKETIFSIAYEFKTSNFQPQWPSDFFHFNQRDIYGGGRNGNDGVVLIPGVYTTFDDADHRKSEWLLIGTQYRFDNGAETVKGGSGNEYDGQPLVFVDNIRQNKKAIEAGTDPELLPSDMTLGEENSGVRFNKYKLGPLANVSYNSTDWNAYRLTWVYFAKAEAIIRKNGGVATTEAVQLINDCKKRAFDPADWPAHEYSTVTLTLDELLAERGREFIFEGFRRQDLIRFDKFTTAAWWDHSPSTETKELFPIPQRQRVLNTNLEQNEGY